MTTLYGFPKDVLIYLLSTVQIRQEREISKHCDAIEILKRENDQNNYCDARGCIETMESSQRVETQLRDDGSFLVSCVTVTNFHRCKGCGNMCFSIHEIT